MAGAGLMVAGAGLMQGVAGLVGGVGEEGGGVRGIVMRGSTVQEVSGEVGGGRAVRHRLGWAILGGKLAPCSNQAVSGMQPIRTVSSMRTHTHIHSISLLISSVFY